MSESGESRDVSQLVVGHTEVPQADQLLQTFPHLRYVVEGQVWREIESTAVTSMLCCKDDMRYFQQTPYRAIPGGPESPVPLSSQ